jgi:hypothetical protein
MNKSGASLTIHALGSLSSAVEPGAKVALTVKYGLITLIHQTADLCDQLANLPDDDSDGDGDGNDLRCPLRAGQIKEITHKVDIPQQVPKGKYTVLADVITKDGAAARGKGGEQITCLESVVYL